MHSSFLQTEMEMKILRVWIHLAYKFFDFMGPVGHQQVKKMPTCQPITVPMFLGQLNFRHQPQFFAMLSLSYLRKKNNSHLQLFTLKNMGH